MKGKKIGYVRVSTAHQNAGRQLEGIPLDKKFIDKVSGKSIVRPQLTAMLDYVREGDTIIVHSMCRLARNLIDLLQLVRRLTQQQIVVTFVKEGLTFSGDDSPMATLLLSVVGSVAQFERSILRERQAEGILLAKREGRYKGRPLLFSTEQIIEIKARAAQGHKKSEIAKDYKVSTPTIFNYLKKRNQ